MNTEGLAEIYWEQLQNNPNKVKVLTDFYCALFNQEFSKDIITSFARYSKIYGVDIVFYSIVDAYSMQDLREGDVRGLINFFAKQRLTQRKQLLELEDLSKYIETTQKNINKTKRTKFNIKDPFENE